MILEPNKLGIRTITRGHDRIPLKTLSVFKGMEMGGLLSMNQKKDITRYMTTSELTAMNDIVPTDYIINIGSNASIIVADESNAIALFTILNGVVTIGAEVDATMENIYKAAQELFFQES